MLDTDIASYAIRGGWPGLDDRLARCRPGEIVISAITLAELRYGLARRPEAVRLARAVQAFCGYVDVVPFAAAEAERYAQLRAGLDATGTPIGDHDTMIAASAIATGAILVTNNSAHFQRVPGLILENWTERG